MNRGEKKKRKGGKWVEGKKKGEGLQEHGLESGKFG